MKRGLANIFKFSTCVVLCFILLTSGVGCLHIKISPKEYEEREVGDFIVWFYKDYCEIYGTTEEGNNKRFLVIPEYIDGVRVDALGVRSLAGAIDMVSGDVTYPRIKSDVLEKIYFESAIVCYPFLSNICDNLKKVIYPKAEEYWQRIKECNVYYPRYVYESKTWDGNYPANVSFYYNYEGAKDDGYYWVDDCDYGEKIEYIPKDPEREGYTFGGWYKEPECINEWDFYVDILPKRELNEKNDFKNIESKIKEVPGYIETILYAKWIQTSK